MASDDCILPLASLIEQIEARIVTPPLGVHVTATELDTPEQAPNNHAHKGVAASVKSTRNLGLSRNRDAARLRAVVVVTLTWRLTGDTKGDRADAMTMGEAIVQRLTDLSWAPESPTNAGQLADRIVYTGATYGYHPTGRGWFVVALVFEFDYDQQLGES